MSRTSRPHSSACDIHISISRSNLEHAGVGLRHEELGHADRDAARVLAAAATSCSVPRIAESIAKDLDQQSASTPSSSCFSEIFCMYFCTPSDAP